MDVSAVGPVEHGFESARVNSSIGNHASESRRYDGKLLRMRKVSCIGVASMHSDRNSAHRRSQSHARLDVQGARRATESLRGLGFQRVEIGLEEKRRCAVSGHVRVCTPCACTQKDDSCDASRRGRRDTEHGVTLWEQQCGHSEARTKAAEQGAERGKRRPPFARIRHSDGNAHDHAAGERSTLRRNAQYGQRCMISQRRGRSIEWSPRQAAGTDCNIRVQNARIRERGESSRQTCSRWHNACNGCLICSQYWRKDAAYAAEAASQRAERAPGAHELATSARLRDGWPAEVDSGSARVQQIGNSSCSDTIRQRR